MGTDNEEQMLVYETEDGILIPIDTIPYIDTVPYAEIPEGDTGPAGPQGVFDCSSFSVTVMVKPDSELAGRLAMLRRLLMLEPLPRKLSRKRFVKWLMAMGVPRDYAAAAAAAGARDCGSYAAAWADLVKRHDTRD